MLHLCWIVRRRGKQVVSYATLEDVAARLGPAAYVQLTDDENAGSANTERIEESLQAAQGEIDSRLACRYATPVDVSGEPEAAALLKALTLDLVEHRLHARRPPVPEAVREAAVNARQWLRDLVHGRAQLPLSKAAAENETCGVVAAVSGSARVFTREAGD